MEFKQGDCVQVAETAEPDATMKAWEYIRNHHIGFVKHVCSIPANGDQGEQLYGIEFPDKFPGGHGCNDYTLSHQGQYFAAKHLRLYPDQTVPNITIPTVPDNVCEL